ncbi:hypothetical protein ACF1BQ_014585 [Bradyrhizobium sp. RDT10]
MRQSLRHIQGLRELRLGRIGLRKLALQRLLDGRDFQRPLYLGVEMLHAGLGGFCPALMRLNVPRRYVRGLGNLILNARRFWIEPFFNGSRAQRIDLGREILEIEAAALSIFEAR